jgi:hypothetical protein
MVDARIRGQNPGNLEHSTRWTWKGELLPATGRFANFVDLEHGFRAMLIDIRNDIKDGQNTIQKIISEWCPPPPAGDCTNTTDYISFVSRITGVPSFATVSYADRDTLTKIARAISTMEHSITPDMSVITRGWDLISSNTYPPPAPSVQPPVIVAATSAQEPSAGSTVNNDLLLWLGGAALVGTGIYLYNRR